MSAPLRSARFPSPTGPLRCSTALRSCLLARIRSFGRPGTQNPLRSWKNALHDSSHCTDLQASTIGIVLMSAPLRSARFPSPTGPLRCSTALVGCELRVAMAPRIIPRSRALKVSTWIGRTTGGLRPHRAYPPLASLLSLPSFLPFEPANFSQIRSSARHACGGALCPFPIPVNHWRHGVLPRWAPGPAAVAPAADASGCTEH